MWLETWINFQVKYRTTEESGPQGDTLNTRRGIPEGERKSEKMKKKKKRTDMFNRKTLDNRTNNAFYDRSLMTYKHILDISKYLLWYQIITV